MHTKDGANGVRNSGARRFSEAAGRQARRHEEAVIQAEIRRLARALRPFGVLHRDALEPAAGAFRWHEGRFKRALAAAARRGAIEPLAAGFFRTPGQAPIASEPEARTCRAGSESGPRASSCSSRELSYRAPIRGWLPAWSDLHRLELQKLAGRVSQHKPATVDGPYKSALRHVRERAGHGLSSRGDEIAKHGMRKAQRHKDPVGPDAAPAVDEMPEQHVQADVNAGLVDDRHVDREVSRVLESTSNEASRQLWVLQKPPGDAPVEQCDSGGS